MSRILKVAVFVVVLLASSCATPTSPSRHIGGSGGAVPDTGR